MTGVVHEEDDAYSMWNTLLRYWFDQFLTLASIHGFCRSFEWFVRFVNFASFILLILVGVELLLCTAVIVVALSQNAITCLTCFLKSS